MTDQFASDLARASKLQNELNNNLSERSNLLSAGTSTGRVDYRLKGGVDTLKNELRGLEKLEYLYENDPTGKFGFIKDKPARVK